jgi:hypothetical protein
VHVAKCTPCTRSPCLLAPTHLVATAPHAAALLTCALLRSSPGATGPPTAQSSVTCGGRRRWGRGVRQWSGWGGCCEGWQCFCRYGGAGGGCVRRDAWLLLLLPSRLLTAAQGWPDCC